MASSKNEIFRGTGARRDEDHCVEVWDLVFKWWYPNMFISTRGGGSVGRQCPVGYLVPGQYQTHNHFSFPCPYIFYAFYLFFLARASILIGPFQV